MNIDRIKTTREYHTDLAKEALVNSDDEAATAAALFLLWTSVDTVAEFQAAVLDSIEVSTPEFESMMAYMELGMIGEASLAIGAREHKIS